ncbi:MAG: hypothetical protein HOW97_25705 [Catenulispora sp.]|nr:hypothetical protein [Catenulispora sp.]
MGRTARSFKLSVVAAATVLAAACSSSGTVGAGGGKINLDTVTAADAVKKASATQITKHTVRVHNDFANKKITQAIDGVQSTERMALASTVVSQLTNPGASPLHGEIRLDAPIVYLDSPGLPDEYRQGKQWIKLDLDHLPPKSSSDRALAFFAALGATYQSIDPKQGSLLPLAMPDLHRVGVETRQGRRVLHIQGSLTPQTVPAAPPPGSGLTQAYLDAQRTQMTQQALTKTTIDLWIGEDGLPVEVKQTQEGDPADGPTTSDITQSDWGTPLVVTPPPADQTYIVPAQ